MAKNNGEKDELLIKLKLIQLREMGSFLNYEGKRKKIKSVGFYHKGNFQEYNTLNKNLKFNTLKKKSYGKIKSIAKNSGILKSPSNSKADVYINNIGFSLKSTSNSPAAILNHTTRAGIEKACKLSNSNVKKIDSAIFKYWKLRKAKFIKEDVSNENMQSPFLKNKKYISPLINYFLFDGTGKGKSPNPAKYILNFQDPLDKNTWEIYGRKKAINKIWRRLVFSIRSKGMPKNYNAKNKSKYLSTSKWTVYFQKKQRGALHVRVKKSNLS